jgi:hypothetical protein
VVKSSYFAGLVQHLLETSDHPDIVKVEPFEEVGAVGFYWGTAGLKVTFRDQTSVFLASTQTSATRGDDSDAPDRFDPADLGEVADVSGVRD